MYFRCRINNDQKKILSKKVDEIKPAEWDIEVPAIKVVRKRVVEESSI